MSDSNPLIKGKLGAFQELRRHAGIAAAPLSWEYIKQCRSYRTGPVWIQSKLSLQFILFSSTMNNLNIQTPRKSQT